MSKVFKNRALGAQRNKLLRYKLIKELYQKTVQEHPYTPITKILEVFHTSNS